jgi:hypothetical protein
MIELDYSQQILPEPVVNPTHPSTNYPINSRLNARPNNSFNNILNNLKILKKNIENIPRVLDSDRSREGVDILSTETSVNNVQTLDQGLKTQDINTLVGPADPGGSAYQGVQRLENSLKPLLFISDKSPPDDGQGLKTQGIKNPVDTAYQGLITPPPKDIITPEPLGFDNFINRTINFMNNASWTMTALICTLIFCSTMILVLIILKCSPFVTVLIIIGLFGLFKLFLLFPSVSPAPLFCI